MSDLSKDHLALAHRLSIRQVAIYVPPAVFPVGTVSGA